MSRLREGRANTARGAAHFLRETVGCARGHSPAGRQRLPQPDGCPLLYHHPPASLESRRYQRRTGLPFPTGWTAPPMSPRRLTPRSRPSRRPAGAASGCEAHTRFPARPLRHRRWNWRPTAPGWRSSPPRAENATRYLKYGVLARGQRRLSGRTIEDTVGGNASQPKSSSRLGPIPFPALRPRNLAPPRSRESPAAVASQLPHRKLKRPPEPRPSPL